MRLKRKDGGQLIPVGLTLFRVRKCPLRTGNEIVFCGEQDASDIFTFIISSLQHLTFLQYAQKRKSAN